MATGSRSGCASTAPPPGPRRGRSRTAGALGPVHTLSAAGGSALNPTRAPIDADGDAVVVWTRLDGTPPAGQARRISAAGASGPSSTLSPGGAGRRPTRRSPSTLTAMRYVGLVPLRTSAPSRSFGRAISVARAARPAAAASRARPPQASQSARRRRRRAATASRSGSAPTGPTPAPRGAPMSSTGDARARSRTSRRRGANAGFSPRSASIRLRQRLRRSGRATVGRQHPRSGPVASPWSPALPARSRPSPRGGQNADPAPDVAVGPGGNGDRGAGRALDGTSRAGPGRDRRLNRRRRGSAIHTLSAAGAQRDSRLRSPSMATELRPSSGSAPDGSHLRIQEPGLLDRSPARSRPCRPLARPERDAAAPAA